MSSGGNCFFAVFNLIPENPVPDIATLDLPPNKLHHCCADFSLSVLASTTFPNDSTKNDVSDFLYYFDPVVTSVDLSLWKFNVATSVWTNAASLNDNTYGNFLPYNFVANNNSGKKFTGYTIAWTNVLSSLGEGSYRVQQNITTAYGVTGTVISNEFCLRNYTPDRADGTIRLEWEINSIMGISEDDSKIRDYSALNRYNAIRLPGYFGYPDSKYKTETIHYNDGSDNWTGDDQSQEFSLQIKMIPYFVHEILRLDFMMADKRYVTNYSSHSPKIYIKKAMNKVSGYAPKWHKEKNELASVEIKLTPFYNNNKKLRN